MKSILVAPFVFLFAIGSFAAESQSQTEKVSFDESQWSVETDFLFHSVAGDAGPLVGPAFFYHLNPQGAIGLRALLGLTAAGETGAYLIEGGYQHGFWKKNKLGLFIESVVALNLRRTEIIWALGNSLGLRYRVNSELHFGGSSGFDLASAPTNGLVLPGGFGFNPRVLLSLGLSI